MISFFISTTCMYLKNQICILRKDEKNSNLHLEKMQIYFYVEKNPDLHLEKMQICFYVEKNLDLDVDLFYFNKKSHSHADY